MPAKLSPAQVERYAQDGFLSPIAALTREQAADHRGKLLVSEMVKVTLAKNEVVDQTVRRRDPRYLGRIEPRRRQRDVDRLRELSFGRCGDGHRRRRDEHKEKDERNDTGSRLHITPSALSRSRSSAPSFSHSL